MKSLRPKHYKSDLYQRYQELYRNLQANPLLFFELPTVSQRIFAYLALAYPHARRTGAIDRAAHSTNANAYVRNFLDHKILVRTMTPYGYAYAISPTFIEEC